MHDKYLIPYQASGPWAYMVRLLPKRIREAEILTYDQTKGKYNPYPNFLRHSDAQSNDEVQQRIADEIRSQSV